MARLRKLKPGKREIVVSLVIFGGVAVFLLFSSLSQSTLGTEYAGTSLPSTVAPGTLSSSQNSPGFAGSQSIPTSGNNRVVNMSEALVGEVRHGQFEPVTGQIISNLNLIGGYVDSSNLMYNGTTWFGVYSVNVPSSSATQFLYDVTNLVNQNGKTTSVQIQTQDVTNQTGGNQSKVPYSLFAITLQEEANTTNIKTNNQFSGVLSSIGFILSVVLSGAAYIVFIVVPIYLIVLGGVLLSSRVLYPMFQRVSKTSQGKKQNEPLA
jgi:hypothetical protein